MRLKRSVAASVSRRRSRAVSRSPRRGGHGQRERAVAHVGLQFWLPAPGSWEGQEQADPYSEYVGFLPKHCKTMPANEDGRVDPCQRATGRGGDDAAGLSAGQARRDGAGDDAGPASAAVLSTTDSRRGCEAPGVRSPTVSVALAKLRQASLSPRAMMRCASPASRSDAAGRRRVRQFSGRGRRSTRQPRLLTPSDPDAVAFAGRKRALPARSLTRSRMRQMWAAGYRVSPLQPHNR